MLDRLAYHLMQFLPAEFAHNVGKWAMQRHLLAQGPNLQPPSPLLFGTQLDNPLALAAGFDKTGLLVDSIREFGFSYVEVGSVTYRGGPGNPKPRVFRLDDHNIMNRMGLPGDPAEVVADRLVHAKSKFFAVNIAKTHDNTITGDAAITDIVSSYKLLKHLGLYTVINISCPNTADGRTFEDCSALSDLLSALAPHRSGDAKPLLIKISPAIADINQLLNITEQFNVDGYVACNTLPINHPSFGKGGQSGDAVRPRALQIIQQLRERTRKPLIACGGVFSHEHLLAYLRAGATVVQAYNGFVRGPTAGPGFAQRVLQPGA